MNIKIIIFIVAIALSILSREKKNYEMPYKLNWKKDVPLISSATLFGITTGIAGNKQASVSEDFINSLKVSDINSFDRSAIYQWSDDANIASDFTSRTAILSPLLLAIPIISQKNFKDLLSVSVMYGEAYLLNMGISGTMQRTVDRSRPFLYGDEIDMDAKMIRGKIGRRSFISGHTSNSFCGAVFFSKVFSDMYPDSNIRFLVWGASLSTATATGMLRYYAGKHFPTDIIAGAAVGSLIGYLVPVFHKNKDKRVNLSFNAGETNSLNVNVRL